MLSYLAFFYALGYAINLYKLCRVQITWNLHVMLWQGGKCCSYYNKGGCSHQKRDGILSIWCLDTICLVCFKKVLFLLLFLLLFLFSLFPTVPCFFCSKIILCSFFLALLFPFLCSPVPCFFCSKRILCSLFRLALHCGSCAAPWRPWCVAIRHQCAHASLMHWDFCCSRHDQLWQICCSDFIHTKMFRNSTRSFQCPNHCARKWWLI